METLSRTPQDGQAQVTRQRCSQVGRQRRFRLWNQQLGEELDVHQDQAGAEHTEDHRADQGAVQPAPTAERLVPSSTTAAIASIS